MNQIEIEAAQAREAREAELAARQVEFFYVIGGGILLLFGTVFGPIWALPALCVFVLALCVWRFTKGTR
jgi:fatty acid desaturase